MALIVPVKEAEEAACVPLAFCCSLPVEVTVKVVTSSPKIEIVPNAALTVVFEESFLSSSSLE